MIGFQINTMTSNSFTQNFACQIELLPWNEMRIYREIINNYIQSKSAYSKEIFTKGVWSCNEIALSPKALNVLYNPHIEVFMSDRRLFTT